MNKKIIFILVILVFYSCELKIPAEPETPSWYLPLTIPLIDTEYSFEGILQDGVISTTAEFYEDCGIDANCDFIDEDGTQNNGVYDLGENYTDENGNGIWDAYGLTDNLENMMQIEFIDDFDSIGLSIVEEQLDMSFFKLDLSEISIDPQIIQEESTYNLGENLPSPLMEPISIDIPIDIPETGNDLVDLILGSCSDFIPSNEQSFSFDVGDLSALPNPIEEANIIINANPTLLEPVEVPLDISTDDINLGDLGSISVIKIILDDAMVWGVNFTNGLPFIIQSLVFNIYKGDPDNDIKLTSLTILDIQPYQTVSENVNFESYELTLDASLFAEVKINLDSEQEPPEDCPLHICVADGVSIDASFNPTVNQNDFSIYNTQGNCEESCEPCIGEDIHACTTDALVDGSVDIDSVEIYDSSEECQTLCDPCYVEPLFACIASGVDEFGNIDEGNIQTEASSVLCENSCNPCVLNQLGLYSCVPGAAFNDISLITGPYLTENDCQIDCVDPSCIDGTTAVCVADAIGDDLSVTGDPTIYQGEGAQTTCEAACNPCIDASTYICTTEESVMSGGDPTIYQGEGAQTTCETSCTPCLSESLSGWNTQEDVPLTFELDGDLLLDTLVIDLALNDTPETDPILVEFPSFNQVQVREALIDDGTHFDDFGLDGVDDSEDEGEQDGIAQEYEQSYSNQFILSVDNGFFGDAELNLDFSNIYENDEIYSQNITIESQNSSLETFDLSNKIIGNKDLGVNLENIEIDYEFSIQDGEYRIPLTDNILSIGETGYSAEVSSMKLKSISAITEEIDFPQVQSVPLQDLPSGFDGFEIYDIFMDMNIYNEITINTVSASFNLTGKKCPNDMSSDACFEDESIESKNFPFNVDLDSSNRTVENPCEHEVGDMAITRISINKDSQITRYFCSEEDGEPYETIESVFDGEENVSLLDFIFFGPNQMNMIGSVLIDGEGTLREADNLWGDFSIRAPLAFVFNEDWVFIPQNISEIDAMDESLSEQIDNSLVEADFNAELTNYSPLGISMSMLISDSTIFPLYIDNLDNLDSHCLNEDYLDQISCEENEFSWVNYSDSLSDLGVSNILFENIDSEDERAYYIEFFTEDVNEEDSLLFWVGRIIDISFIEPQEVDENGFVTIPSVSFSTEVLDAERVSWFTADEKRYIVPMITLASTEGNPSSLQTTNYLGVRSFLTLILDTEGINKKNEKMIINEKNTSLRHQ